MKLASLRNGTLDGSLIVVSRDGKRAAHCGDVAPNLRTALEQWPVMESRLRERFDALEGGAIANEIAFDPGAAAAPLPRAPQLLDGSAYKTHGDLLSRAFGALPDGVYTERPLMYQGTSDDLLGATDDVALPSEEDGIDFEGEVVVIVSALPLGASEAQALAAIRLITVMNDVSLRAHAKDEIAAGFGFVQAKPRSSFAPLAITPDELGPAWQDGRVHLRLHVSWNGTEFGRPSAGPMAFSFPQLIAYAARRRTLGAGTIVGSGTVSNDDYADVGSACIAERRMIELLRDGKPKTPFMSFGDRVRMELLDERGASVCGAIDQRIVAAPARVTVSR